MSSQPSTARSGGIPDVPHLAPAHLAPAQLGPGSLDPGPLDAADPLRTFRDRFALAEPGLVYLDGNSLGRPPLAALERISQVANREWAGELVRGWEHWLDLPLRAGDALAPVLGAAPGTVAVGDSTTISLYRLAAAAIEDRPGRRAAVAARDEFPTDRYVLEGLARERDLELRWIDADRVDGPSPADVAALLDEEVALVLLSVVGYRSGALADVDAIEALARSAGAHVLWDASHAGGVVPLRLAARDIGLAVGCTYKYLDGGPGAPAWAYVAPRLVDRLRPPVSGWFAQADQFAMGPAFERRPGIAGWLAGTPSPLALAGVIAGAELVAEAGIEAIRAKSVALTAYAIELYDALLAPLGCGLGTPRDQARRGSHVAVCHPEAKELTAALVAQGVVPDFREPDIVRLGLSPLTTSFSDVRAGIEALAAVVRDLDRGRGTRR